MENKLNIYDCVVTEDEWLDISFTTKNILEEQQQQLTTTTVKRQKGAKSVLVRFVKNHYKKVAVAVLVLALLAGMRFVDGGLSGEIFTNARTAFTSGIFSNNSTKDTIKLPVTYTVAEVKDGEVVISGSKLVLNISSGIVDKIVDSSVEVKVSDKLTVVYTNISDILVEQGQIVAMNDILGKYKESASFCIVYNGSKVVNVVASNGSITWQV